MSSSEVNATETVAEVKPLEVNTSQVSPLAKLSPADAPSDQWRQFGEQISAFLAELPDYVTEFFSEYQRPLLTVGLAIAALVTVKVTLAILDAINDIPLLSPVFELVGIGYTGWFVYRYLLRASTRQELGEELNTIKGQVIGSNSTDS